METPAKLREKAKRYRQMIPRTTDHQLKEALRILADEYEVLASQIEREASEDK